MFEEIKNDLKDKMNKALAIYTEDLAGIRTGRVSANFLNSVQVDAYGGDMLPLNQVGTVTVQDGNMLIVQVWDGSVVKKVEKAINIAGLGVNASADGQLVRIPVPNLSEERRKELVKICGKTAEHSRIAIRNIRRQILDSIKDATAPKDDLHKATEDIQKITDDYISKIDTLLADKEKEIMKV